ncbi:MAG: HigA family addiction module antidote protein [Gammaproteobacteria bacterium]|nr:HigA family addiction module antidote protein [Gammaproteobacteria bacterium]
MNITERKPFTPGEILQEEFMEPYELTQTKLAELTGLGRRRINEIINGRRGVTPDTALRLAKLFKVSPDYWLNLQIKLDLWNELHKKSEKELLRKIKPLKLNLAYVNTAA